MNMQEAYLPDILLVRLVEEHGYIIEKDGTQTPTSWMGIGECTATTRKGQPCKNMVTSGQVWDGDGRVTSHLQNVHQRRCHTHVDPTIRAPREIWVRDNVERTVRELRHLADQYDGLLAAHPE